MPLLKFAGLNLYEKSSGLQKGHTVRFFLDGAIVSSGGLSASAEGVQFGSHSANFIVVGPNGTQMISSPTIHFQLQNRINPRKRK